MNANAGVDAVNRMLNNTKHKIDQIIIIDPSNQLAQGIYSKNYGHPSELTTALIYANSNPSIPCAVIV